MRDPTEDIIRRLTELEQRVQFLETYQPPALGARVYRVAAQNIASGANVAITYDTVRWDTGSFWSGANPTRLTAATAGWYEIGSANGWANAGDATLRQIGFRINGTTFILVTGTPAVNGNVTRISGEAIYKLAAGDYVENVVHQASAGVLALEIFANFSPEFWIHRLV